jgi:uncharacterized protein (TIGR03000 family)
MLPRCAQLGAGVPPAEVRAMNTFMQRLTAGLAMTVLCLVLAGPAMAQSKGGGIRPGGMIGPGVRPAGAGSIRPAYYSTYDPFGYNYYLNKPGNNPFVNNFHRGGTYGYGYDFGYGYNFGYGYGYTPSYYPYGDDFAQPDVYQSYYPYQFALPTQPLAARPLAVPNRAPPPDKAEVQIFVVDPAAEIWFNGVKMEQTGQERELLTPELTPGKSYTYEVRARWTQNGKQYERTRSITVRAGEQIGLTFAIDQQETLPPPTAKE